MTAANDGDHLHSSVKPLLQLSDTERIEYMNGDRWVPYQSANSVFAELDHALRDSRRLRPQCLAICANPNNGKTSAIDKFVAKHSHGHKIGSEADRGPVHLVEAPPSAGESRLYGAILRPFGFPARGSVEGLMTQVHDLLTELGVRMLIIDEFHNLLLGGPVQQRQTMAVLKGLTNKPLGLSIVAVGTDEVLSALATSRQLLTRFKEVKLPTWRYDACGRTLLQTYEVRTPLKRRSNLAGDRALGEEIMQASDGLLGNIDRIIAGAAIAAIESGEEQITLKIVESLDFVNRKHRSPFQAKSV